MTRPLDHAATREAAQHFSDTADKLVAIGHSAPEVLAGLHYCLLHYGQQAFGPVGLIEWLRNSADQIERKLLRG